MPYKNPADGIAYRERTKKERAEYTKQYRADNKEFIAERGRVHHIKSCYGLSMDEYESLIAKGCTLCGSMDNLHIDHDHSCCPTTKTCGQCIRGVLCGKHNMALGLFNDDLDMLHAAIVYLAPRGPIGLDKPLRTDRLMSQAKTT